MNIDTGTDKIQAIKYSVFVIFMLKPGDFVANAGNLSMVIKNKIATSVIVLVPMFVLKKTMPD